MPTPRRNLGTSAVNGKIYAIGGRPGLLKTVEEYDPLTDTWMKKADMPTARYGVATCVVEGRIYAIGSGTDNADFSDVEEYDPLTDTWTKRSDMLTARYAVATGVVNGKIYAIGGRVLKGNDDVPVPTVEEYDPLTDTWIGKADMPEEFVTWGCSSVVNGKIYLFGGLEGKIVKGQRVDAVATVKCYDPATDTWTRKMDMPSPRAGASASAVNGKIYVIGGKESYGAQDNFLDAVEEYTPEGWPFSVSFWG